MPLVELMLLHPEDFTDVEIPSYSEDETPALSKFSLYPSGENKNYLGNDGVPKQSLLYIEDPADCEYVFVRVESLGYVQTTGGYKKYLGNDDVPKNPYQDSRPM